MALTPITCTDDVATSVAFPLSGPVRLRADDLGGNDQVVVYEERVDGAYEPAKDQNGNRIVLTVERYSLLIEGYGSYKCVGSRDGLQVGYAS